jgi:hypothetical protein
MIEITPETMRRAIERAGKMRCRNARRLDDNRIELTCAHDHRHAITFTHFDGQLYAECFMPETGEVCPSDIGGRACYHIAAAVAVRDAIEEVRVAALRSRRRAADPDGAVEIAVKFDGPMPATTRPLPPLSTKRHKQQDDSVLVAQRPRKVPEFVRGFQI